jgi:hypothetical protein
LEAATGVEPVMEVLQFHSARIHASHLTRASLEKSLLVGYFPSHLVISRLEPIQTPKARPAGKCAGNAWL